jgi:hypothetical protein
MHWVLFLASFSKFLISFAEGALNNDYHVPDSLELRFSKMPAMKDGKTETKKPKSVAGTKQTPESKDRKKAGLTLENKPAPSVQSEDSNK